MKLRNDLLGLMPDERRVSVSESVLRQHSEDMTYHPPREPDVVVYPESTEEVARVLAYANERRISVVPFGMGTSLEGHVIPLEGGISLDLSRLNRILAVRADDLTATVEAGVTRGQLNARVGGEGLFFPVDPGADATLGGMAATNASGTTTVRYGGMRSNVLALEVVLADGTVLRPGSRAIKTSAGYDLRALFVGSEGTLAVITELTLRLYGIPDYTVAARAVFPDVDAACRAAATMIGSGVMVTRVELLDAGTWRAINAYKESAYPEEPTLLVEFSGSEAGVAGDLDATREIAESEGCTSFVFEADADGRARLWEARHSAAFALLHSAPGRKHKSTDVCVPVSELPGAITLARSLIDERGLTATIIGHVGDGNFHVGFMVDADDLEEIARAEAFNHELVEYALAHGGTCTGEHGIGIGKIPYLQAEHGDLIPYLRGVKDLFDPRGILNPGKVLPPR
jgi:D-lactate dehydrogenase (cytochrome)